MKISEIRVTPINIPLEAPYKWSVGTFPGITKVIVEILTDEGLIGLGEAPSLACCAIITEELAPRLIGANALDIELCERRCLPETKVLANTDDNAVLRAFGGVEMALWDLRGKAWKQPLYMLLGGAVRKEIQFCEYFAPRQKRGDAGGEATPSEVAAYCAEMRAHHGSVIFEGKCMNGDVDGTVEMVRLIREAVGQDAVIRLDGNMGFSVHAARQLLAKLEPYHISNFEDPVASFFDMARLRQHSGTPFSSHFPDLRLAVELGVPDTFVLNLTALGGIRRTVRFIAACEAMGIDFSFYSGDTGIATAAYLHVGSALRHVHQPSQSLLRWQTDDVIEEGPLKPEKNTLPVPEGHGLGVTLSRSALKRCHERFLAEGPYDHYDNPDSPGNYVRLPLV